MKMEPRFRSRSHYYLLNGREVVGVDDIMEWSRRRENEDRVIARTILSKGYVSTVFLGLDHDFYNADSSSTFYQPLVFETMVFGTRHDGAQWRYRTYDDAELGHAHAVEVIGFHPWRFSWWEFRWQWLSAWTNMWRWIWIRRLERKFKAKGGKITWRN